MQLKRNMTSLSALSKLLALVFAVAVLILVAGCVSGNDSSSSSSGDEESFESVSDEALSDESSDSSASAESESDSTPQATPYADALTGQLEAIAANSSMNVGIAFVDLENPSDACYVQADRSQRSASMIKLIILNELFEQINQGSVSLDEGYTLTGGDIVGGTGVLQGRGAGATVTFSEMAELMISASDNVATNVIINRLGMDSINARAAELGLGGTSLNRLMMDTDAIAAGIENYMSARDAATLLQMIHAGTFVDAQASQFAMSALQNQSDSAGILAGLQGAAFAHKTGTLSNAQNDAGIVLGNHPYVLSVFCEAGDSGAFSQGEAYDIMRQCGECTTAVVG